MTTVNLLLAALPILTLIGLLAFRVPPLPAVLVTLVLTAVLSFRFPIGIAELSELGSRFGGVTLSVALIMFGGILLAEMVRSSGAQELISTWLNTAAHSRERAILLLGFAVTPFVESVIGWGIGIIVGVPLLMRAGLDTTRAATVSLLGLTLCPWGALAPGLLLIQEMSGVPLHDLGLWIALFNIPVLAVLGVSIVIVGVGRSGFWRSLFELGITLLTMTPVLIATNLWLTPALAGVFASITAMCTLLGIARLRGRLPRMSRATMRAFSPYVVLITAILGALGLAQVVDLGPATAVITSPGLWLLATAALTPALLRIEREKLRTILGAGIRTWLPVFTVTILFIFFGGLLSVNGMGDTLAMGAATLGVGFIVMMPLVGALGGYLTASNTSAGALLALGTAHATTAIGANPLVALGSQTAAAGSAILASPARVALAVTLVDGMRAPEEPAANLRRVAGVSVLANIVVVAVLTPIVAILA